VAAAAGATSAGRGGVANNETAGTATSAPAAGAAAQVLDGFSLLKPCVSSFKPSGDPNNAGDCCYTTDFDGADRQPHSVYKNDYTVTITIPGQAQLDFYTIDGDHHQVTNNGTMSVPNLKTPQPYNGNFLEFTVLEVAVGN
jgi:hypothetical protein